MTTPTPSTEDLLIMVAINVGQLHADLRAAEARLDAMGNAGQAAGQEVESGMMRARRAANDFGAAVVAAGAAATAALAGVIASTIETVDVINRMSGATGLAAEEFQYYAAGARMLGFEQDALGAIFQDFQDKVGDFINTGGGGMIDFFEQVAPLVGVTVDQFKNLSGAEGLQLYVDSLEKANLSQAEFNFFLEAVASDSSALLPLLRNGGEGFRFFGEQAQQAGAILDSDLIRSTTELKVQINELSANFTGARNEVASVLIPTLLDLNDAFNDSAQGGEAMVGVAAAIATTVKLAGVTALGAVSAFELFGKSLAAFGTVFDGVTEDTLYSPVLILRNMVRNVREDGSAFDAALADLSATATARGAQLQKAWEAGLGNLDLSIGTEVLTAQTRRTGGGGMGSTQAERDKQAALDKANAARIEADKKAAQTQLENQQAAAEALRKSLLEQLMNERELLGTATNAKVEESLRLTKGLENGAQMHADNMLAIRADYQAKLADIDAREMQAEIEAAATAGTANAELHEQEMAARIARAEQLRQIDMQQRALTEEGKLAQIEENHIMEQELIAELFEEGFITEQERAARLLELDRQTKEARLNATKELFDGQRELQALYEDTTLKNAANFFALDLGGFSKHSRKMFEVQKAAKIAQVALSIPEAVSDAFNAGNKIAGPKLGAAYAAVALVQKLGQLRDIRSATYGGGGGGSSGGGGGGGSLPQPEEQQQPQIERFVNLSIIGESNDITSIGNVRNLIERINTEIQNGAVLRVNS